MVPELPEQYLLISNHQSLLDIVAYMNYLRGGAYRVKALKVYPAPETKEAQLKILEEGKALIQEQLAQWRK